LLAFKRVFGEAHSKTSQRKKGFRVLTTPLGKEIGFMGKNPHRKKTTERKSYKNRVAVL